MVQQAKLSDYKVEPDLDYKDTFGFYRYFREILPIKLDMFDTFMQIKRNGTLFSLKRESYRNNYNRHNHIKETLTARYISYYRRYNMNTLADYVDLGW